MDGSNRLKILYVSSNLLLALFRQNDGRQLYFEGMPEDARLVGVSDQIRFDKDQIALKIWSATFPEVMDGNQLSELKVVCSNKPVVRSEVPPPDRSDPGWRRRY
jgi:hypothetical protein